LLFDTVRLLFDIVFDTVVRLLFDTVVRLLKSSIDSLDTANLRIRS